MSRKNCRNYETVNFYCINCGNKGIPIARMGNNRKDKGHRKNMYCPTCRHTVNHIEGFLTDLNKFLHLQMKSLITSFIVQVLLQVNT